MTPARFQLIRHVDVSNVSGTGIVAEGVRFSDGKVALRWCVGDHRSTVLWDDMASVSIIHGHGGNTEVHWLDSPHEG